MHTHMVREHGHFSAMTKWHCLHLYRKKYPKLDKFRLNVVMVRDWKMATIMGLNSMRLPVENALDSEGGHTETQYEATSSHTVTEQETIEDQFGLMPFEEADWTARPLHAELSLLANCTELKPKKVVRFSTEIKGK